MTGFSHQVKDTQGLLIPEEMSGSVEIPEREFEHWRALVEPLADPILIYDKRCRRVVGNRAAAELEVMHGAYFCDALTEENSREKVGFEALILRNVQRVLTSKERIEAECQLLGLDEKLHDFSVRFLPVGDEQGLREHVMVVGRDVSLLRETEAYFSSFAALGGGFFFTFHIGTDHGFSMPFAGEGIRDLLGLCPEEVAIDAEPFVHRIHPHDINTLFEIVFRSVRDLRPCEMQFRVRHPEKGIRWLKASVQPRRGQGLGSSWYGFMWDITDRKNLEDMHNRNSLTSLGVLAAGIAHEFNNKLTSIQGQIAWALEQIPMKGAQRVCLESAALECDLAAELTRRLITFSKGGDPVRSYVLVEYLIGEVLRPMVNGSRIRLEVCLEGVTGGIQADEGQIRQVFREIVCNAIQAMPQGGALYVRADVVMLAEVCEKPDLPPGKYVRISFTDEGCGIEREELKHVFAPFRTSKQGAVGIGLALCRSVVERHGGCITLTSCRGTGTTVTMFLPASEFMGLNSSQFVPSTGSGIPETVLVMDDDPSIRKLVAAVLSQLGSRVITCWNGEEAVSLYREAMESGQPFDMGILDLCVPNGTGGKEAAAQILALDPSARLVVSSGYCDDPVMVRPGDYGFKGNLHKPFTIRQLRKIVRE